VLNILWYVTSQDGGRGSGPQNRPSYSTVTPDRSSAAKTLSFGEKIAKIGPADPEIICLRKIIKKE